MLAVPPVADADVPLDQRSGYRATVAGQLQSPGNLGAGARIVDTPTPLAPLPCQVEEAGRRTAPHHAWLCVRKRRPELES
jgi:hypothetical protein